MQIMFIKPETLDVLAEQILIACSQTVDAEENRVLPRLDHSKAPEAVRLALNEIFGGGHNWASLGEWPRPGQMGPVADIFAQLEAAHTSRATMYAEAKSLGFRVPDDI